MGSQIAPADQQRHSQLMITAGGSGPLDVVQLKAAVGAANVYRFDRDFQIVFDKGLCDFRQGAVYALHAPLKAALLAVAAPMTQL